MKKVLCLPILLLGLCLPTVAVAQADVSVLVKADMNCTWELDGLPMGSLSDSSSTAVVFSVGQHLIEASTTDGLATTKTKIEIQKFQSTVEIQLKRQHDGQMNMQHADKPGEPAGADAAQLLVWTDPATGLMWTRKDNGSDVGQPQAEAFCSNLSLAGHNWRLATPEELQSIYDPGVSLKQTFDSGQTNDVHIKGKIQLTGWTWSQRQGDNPGKPYQSAWLFKFGEVPGSHDFGKPLENFLHFSWDMRALCVRGTGE